MKVFDLLFVVACLVWTGSLGCLADPVPQPPKPTAATLLAVLGKPPVSKEMKELVAELNTQPTVSYAFWNGTHTDPTSTTFHLKWKKQGVELYVEDNTIKAFWLYDQDSEGYHRFSGELPLKLRFDDDLASLAKKLGPPDEEPGEAERLTADGKPYDIIFAHYKDGYVNVNLHRVDGKEQVRTIGFHYKEQTK